MRRAVRITGYILGGLVGLLVLIAAGVYTASEATIRRTYDVPLAALVVPQEAADIAEGERLARIRGCFGGCHGTTLEGRVFFDEPGVATIPAPNLTRVVREYSDAELERAIRRGVTRTGRSVFAMPSDMFAGLADEDLAHIIAFLRSQPEIDGTTPQFRAGPKGRLGIVLGMFSPLAPQIRAASRPDVPRDDELEWGRYLVRTVCTECHGHDLRGDASGRPPDLRIAAAFDEAGWFELMRSGRGLGGRELDLMAQVALSRFSYMTDDELRAVHAYLNQYAVTGEP
jgi:cytochrome c553